MNMKELEKAVAEYRQLKAMKEELEAELKEAENAIEKLNLKLIQKEEFHLPIENSKRTIIKLQKIKKTNNKYPRNFAQIIKNPL